MSEVFDLDPNAPWNDEEENECPYCGNPCKRSYCNDEHKNAEIKD